MVCFLSLFLVDDVPGPGKYEIRSRLGEAASFTMPGRPRPTRGVLNGTKISYPYNCFSSEISLYDFVFFQDT